MKKLLLVAGLCLLMGNPALAQRKGTAPGGSAAGSSSQGASSTLEYCDEPMGTVGVVEDQGGDWYRYLTSDLRLPSTIPLLRMMIQQSNCFVVVERGRAMQNMMQERQLMDSGELREGSDFGKGQMVAADYSLNPSINFSQSDAGGIGGMLGAFSGRKLGLLSSVVGGLKFKRAESILTMVDNRSGVQIATAQGQGRKTDFGVGIAGWGGSGYGALGGYTNTPEGKVIALAFADAYNNLVRSLRNYQPQEVQGGLGKGGKLKVGN
jgi:curli biogenesis system outer membrane secretion channel CsgG